MPRSILQHGVPSTPFEGLCGTPKRSTGEAACVAVQGAILMDPTRGSLICVRGFRPLVWAQVRGVRSTALIARNKAN